MALVHPEIEQWILMTNFKSPIIISASYMVLLIIGLVVRGRYSEFTINLSYELRRFYVYVSAVANWVLLIFFLVMSVLLKYNYMCEPPSKSLVRDDSLWKWLTEDTSAEEKRIKGKELFVAKGMWVFFLTKIFDFSDHFALVLSNNPVRVDHILHHIVMVSASWFGLKYLPGGSTIIWVMINCAFLSIAFTWHILAHYSSGRSERTMSWKPLVNLCKNLHFFLVGLHSVTIINAKCPYPSKYAFFVLGFVSLIIFLSLSCTDGFGSAGGRRRGEGGNPRRRNSRNDSDSDEDDNNPKEESPSTAPATTNSSNPENPPTSGDQTTNSSDTPQEAPKSGDDTSSRSQAFHCMPLRSPFSSRVEKYPLIIW
ncbi:Elongation of very long chain fatty acids protein 5 [Orchesella cincta]|uniref:Elongation of very long chain fatty acids protein n=1 Tax=Orchesella cincta TaxID=48709 RepID=A0A1D2NH43_ORCCI|nr:Elongation of very long chain fatty acids protein 5 [Orchesella cincta]